MVIYSWFTYEHGWFSIAMLVYQRVDCLDCLDIGVIIGFWRRHPWALARCLWLRHPTSRSSKQTRSPRLLSKACGTAVSISLNQARYVLHTVVPGTSFHEMVDFFEFSTAEPGCKSEYLTIYPPRNVPTIAVATHLPQPKILRGMSCLCRAPKLERSTAHASGPCSCVVAQRPSFQCGKHVTQHLINSEENPLYQIFGFLLLELPSGCLT